MPVIAELGIGENQIYTGENQERHGYLEGQIPLHIWDYWLERNLWGRLRAEHPEQARDGTPAGPSQSISYKFISNQGHLSPSYT